jgi:UDPglucose 6-dehydrogenase
MKREIIIAGYGFVGKAVANSINDHCILHICDPKINENTVADFKYADGVIICVGTPSTAIGDCDVNQIYQVMDTVPVHIPVLLKSTIPPNYLERLLANYPNHSICYSPEFLRAVSANEDFANQTYMVMGGDDPEGMWQTLFQESCPKLKLVFNTSITEASMIKYATNCFLSVKVTFFNQIYDMCKLNGADYDLVRQVLTHDTRIGNSHMMVPGPDGSRGFGGACFPKDTNAFVHYADTLQVSHTLVESAIKYNKKVRKNP